MKKYNEMHNKMEVLELSNHYKALEDDSETEVHDEDETVDVNAVDSANEYKVRVSATIDSGAAVNVMPSGWFNDYNLKYTAEIGATTKQPMARRLQMKDFGAFTQLHLDLEERSYTER